MLDFIYLIGIYYKCFYKFYVGIVRDFSKVVERDRYFFFFFVSMDKVVLMVMDNVYCFLKIVISLENFLGYIFVFDVFVKELFFSFFVFIKDGYVVLLFDGFGERLVFGLVIVGEMIECYIVFGYVMRIIIGVLVFFGVDVVV